MTPDRTWLILTEGTLQRERQAVDDSVFFPIILTDLNLPWEKALHQGTPISFSARSILSGNRSSDSGLYYIRRGVVRLSNIALNGQERVMLYMGKGTLFNEIPMLQFSHDYLFTCMEQTDTVFWPKKRLNEDFIREYPLLMFNFLESMSAKSRNFYTQLCNLRAYNSFGNVCRLLYSMNLFNRKGDVIVPMLTQLELAAFLGIHRSSLHKAMSRLKDEGIIGEYSKKSLEIYDLARLREHAEDTGDE